MRNNFVVDTLPAFPQMIMAVIESLASGHPSTFTGYNLQVIPSYRGETRVWKVSHCQTGTTWYVKRVQNSQIFGRYVESLNRLGCLTRKSCAIRAPDLVGMDFQRLLVATTAVKGTSAQKCFVNGTRFDKIMYGTKCDLAGLADVLSEALIALQNFTCDSHSDLQDFTSTGTADRMRGKLQRLLDAVPETYARIAPGVDRALNFLQSIQRPCSLLLGDVDLSHLLIENGRLGIVDLDDVGVGDWMRDVAYLINFVQYRNSSLLYSSKRVAQFQQALLDRLNVKDHDPLISIYRMEFCLDYLWNSVRSSTNSDLPIHNHSIRSIERQTQKLLKRVV